MTSTDRTFLVLTFPTTHAALKFESTFKDSGLSFQLIPVPREISSSCGLAASIPAENESKLLAEIERRDIEFEELYRLFHEKGIKPQLLRKHE